MSGDKELGGFSRHSPSKFETAQLSRSVFLLKNMKLKTIVGIVIVVVIGFVLAAWLIPKQKLGQAPSGLNSLLAVATTTAVGPQQNKTIFSSNSQCTGRVIGTAGSAVMVAFGDPTNGDISSTTLTSMVGFMQGASTTVAYDSGVYGCGRWSVYGIASSTITTTEFR